MRKFEDKAKTNTIGITIVIPLIINSHVLFESLESKSSFAFIHWVSFILLLLTLIYLLVSGVIAIKIFSEKNIMSTVELCDLSADDIKTKQRYYACIYNNTKRNLIRNNYVNSSYMCIRNALFCLLLLFIIIYCPCYT